MISLACFSLISIIPLYLRNINYWLYDNMPLTWDALYSILLCSILLSNFIA